MIVGRVPDLGPVAKKGVVVKFFNVIRVIWARGVFGGPGSFPQVKGLGFDDPK